MLFGVGTVGFLSQIFRATPSEAMIYGSIILMGVPVVQRLDNPPPPRQPDARDNDEDDDPDEQPSLPGPSGTG